MKNAIAIFIASLSLLLNMEVASAEKSGLENHVSALMAHARHKELVTSRQWIRLGHWRQSIWHDGWKGENDSSLFFLSPKGKVDPAAEMEATLKGFFADPGDPNKHAICRFPARYQWLRSQLDFDMSRIKLTRCPDYESYLQKTKAKSVTLIFSSYFLGKAASAFGHTFFRVNKSDASMAVGKKRQLLDTGVDYSATVTTSNSAAYAIMGIFGMFEGNFRKMPYYYKVREYNDYESRDLWEYDLNLTQEQVDRFVAHLWELGPTHFDYFYLTENCSYHILGLLEAAAPDLDLITHLKTPVIPADTIKAIYANPSLVREVLYRPSLYTQFQHRVKQMSGREREAVEELAENPMWSFPENISEEDKIAVLDAAADLLDLRHAESIISDPSSKPAKAKRNLLARRAKIFLPSKELEIEPPWDKMPQAGHGTRRLGAGIGFADNKAYASLRFRVTMHDLADPADGYPELSNLEFLRFQARFSFLDSSAYIEEATFLDIKNIVPLDRFSRGVTWKLKLGASRFRDAGCDSCLVGQARGGAGYALAGWNNRLAVFTTVDALVAGGPNLDGLGDSAYRLGVGPFAGMRIRWTADLVSVITGEWIYLPKQAPSALWGGQGIVRWQYKEGVALNLEVRQSQRETDASLSWLVYY